MAATFVAVGGLENGQPCLRKTARLVEVHAHQCYQGGGQPPSLQAIWRKHARTLSIVETAGDHSTMFSATNAESTAASLTRCLEKTAMHRLLVILAVVFMGSVSTLIGQAPERPAVYTAAQAAAGRIELQQNSFGACTACHTTALTGRKGDIDELPPLSSLPANYQQLIRGNGGKVPAFVGPQFMARWAARTTKDLSTEFQIRFAPPAANLSEETRLNLIAYILQANGALPGTQPLTMATDVEIGALIPSGTHK